MGWKEKIHKKRMEYMKGQREKELSNLKREAKEAKVRGEISKLQKARTKVSGVGRSKKKGGIDWGKELGALNYAFGGKKPKSKVKPKRKPIKKKKSSKKRSGKKKPKKVVYYY